MRTEFADTRMNELRSSESALFVLEIVRTGTPVKAAKAMSRAPSTIYRAIDRLEKEIGAPLFDRLPAGWQPTEIGRRIVRLAETLEREIVQTELYLLEQNRDFPGPLRLSASDGLAEGYLAPIVADFARLNADLTVELIVDNHFADLARRQADIAVRPHHRPGEGLIGRRAGKLAHALYGAASLFAGAGMPTSLAELGRFRRCVLSPSLDRHTAARWKAGPEPTRGTLSVIANTEMGLAAAIAAGAGIGVLPCFLGDGLPNVRRLPSIAVGAPVDIWLVTHSALRKNPVIRALLQAVADAMKRDATKLSGQTSALRRERIASRPHV